MDPVVVGTLVIRVINAVAWTLVCIRILQHDRPIPRLTRGLLVTVIIGGMWVLVQGGLIPFGFPPDIARIITTAFTVYAGLIALAIWTTDILD